MERALRNQVVEDLKNKMVFLGGPRQVGKTTLARDIGPKNAYLNWDVAEDRRNILSQNLPSTDRWIFDEIHKYKNWRNYLKGLFDKHKKDKQILVTGSARLDLLRRGGDSLQGRYHYLRLYPFTLDELGTHSISDLEQLMMLSGFPEPFLSSNKIVSQRWSNEYRQRVIEEDIAAVETIEDLGKAEHLLINLPDYVGTPLSLNSLSEDLNVAHKTVTRWLQIFEMFYAVFRLSPFGYKGLRSVKKEKKHYHFDWTLIEEESYRFENMVAVHLLKRVHFLKDTEGQQLELQYFRDTDKREVDFVLTKKNKPILFLECKLAEKDVSPHLVYLKRKFPAVQAIQINYRGKFDFVNKEGIRIAPAVKILNQETLNMLLASEK